jgi:hypothetical protein
MLARWEEVRADTALRQYRLLAPVAACPEELGWQDSEVPLEVLMVLFKKKNTLTGLSRTCG